MGVLGDIPAPTDLLKRKKLMDEITKERVLPSPFAVEDGRSCNFFSSSAIEEEKDMAQRPHQVQ